MKKLFQYAVVYHEYDDSGKYKDSVVVTEPTVELAKTEGELLFKITRSIPEKYASDPDHVQISIRNF